MFAIGNNELELLPPLKAGQRIVCPAKCGKRHTVKNGKNEDGSECTVLQFVSCGKKAYLVGIDGKRLK
jgi:hypothetical protein